MALPVNTVDFQKEQEDLLKQQAKNKQTINFPYVQPGNQIPLTQTAVQPPASQTVPPATPATDNFQKEQENLLKQQTKNQQTIFSPEEMQAALRAQPPETPSTVAAPAAAASATATPAAAPAAAPTEVAGEVKPTNIQDVTEEKAIGGFSSEEMDLLNNLVNRFLQDPSLGGDPQLARQKALDEFNKQRAQGFEAYRQATGGMAGLGKREEALLASQLQTSTERAEFKRDTDIQQQDAYRQQMLQALAIGTENVGLQQAIFAGDIDAMIRAAGGSLGFADLAMRQNVLLSQQEYDKWKTEYQGDLQTALQSNDINAIRENLRTQLDFDAHQAGLGREFTAGQNALNRALDESIAYLNVDAQREFINLKADIDKDMLMSEQSFTAGQAELERALREAMQANDVEATFALQEAMNQFTELQNEAARQWQSAERVASQAWMSDERISEQDFKHAVQLLDQNHQLALQDNDITAQKDIEEMKANLQLKLQTQGMEHDEKMTYLNAELQEAKDNNDFQRQKEIMLFQTEQQFQLMDKEQGFVEAMKYLDQEMTLALQNNDFDHMKQLEKMKFEHELTMHNDNMRIQEMKIALDQQGLDMAKIDSEYMKIMGQIEQGILDPDAGYNFLLENLSPENAGLLEKSDPMAWQESMTEDYLMQQYQFALTQGLDLQAVGDFDAEGNFLGLNDQYLQQYNDWMNNTLYLTDDSPTGQMISEFKSGEENAVSYFSGKDKADPIYQALLADNTTIGWTSNRKIVGSGSTERTVYSNMPPVGGFLQKNGSIFQLKSKRTDDKFGTDEKIYVLVNILTGKRFEITTASTKNAESFFEKYS